MKDTSFYNKLTLNCRGKIISLQHPRVMGILNITSDSFYNDSRTTEENAEMLAIKMVEDGADFIDVGGYSTRPGHSHLTLAEELDRVIPVINKIHKAIPETPISVDTFRSQVASEAIRAGASLINDISGGSGDPDMFKTVAALKVPYVLMHIKNNPQNMHDDFEYNDLMGEMIHYYSKKVFELTHFGVNDILIDPGFGFSKNLKQNHQLLNQLTDLSILSLPILVGLSRKSMIYNVLNNKPNEALNGTIALNTIALLKGAKILRVHDVKPAKELIKLVNFMPSNF